MTWGTKNMPPKKNLSRGCLSNWCDADADEDADSSKTICRPPPYGGVDIITVRQAFETMMKIFTNRMGKQSNGGIRNCLNSCITTTRQLQRR